MVLGIDSRLTSIILSSLSARGCLEKASPYLTKHEIQEYSNQGTGVQS